MKTPLYSKFLPACLKMAVLSLALSFSAAQGAVMFTHSGDADPTTEGWTLTSGGSTGLATGSVNIGGVPAWKVYDSHVDSDGNTHNLTYKELISEDPFLSGWSLKATISLEGIASTTNATLLGYATYYKPDGTLLTGNAWSYQVIFGATDGKTTVGLYGYSGNAVLYTAPDTGFVNVELKYNPGDTAASLYVNGDLIVNDYQGVDTGYKMATQIWWGKGAANSVSSTRTANWASVRFEVVPEPSPVAMLAMSLGFAVAVGAVRRKWTPFRNLR